MDESNRVFEELKKLDKRIDKLSDPKNLGTVLWGEVSYYIKEALNAIKEDKLIYNW